MICLEDHPFFSQREFAARYLLPQTNEHKEMP